MATPNPHLATMTATTEELTDGERRVRVALETLYRFVLAVFVSCQLFDFLFSPIWMHGYLWCLNLPVDVDWSDKSAGVILEHQLEEVGNWGRLGYSVSHVAVVFLFLRLSGFDENRSVWRLLRLAAIFGLFVGSVRCLQLRHRLYSALHEGFFIYFHFFAVGLCLTLRPMETTNRSETKTESLRTSQ